ncbi:MAG: hypothetical protein F4107_08295 [Gemmatimonadetes bacterium]|nr:hypothetical protein [Gemmatimonadota bacterium]MYD12127.1 hypothetical protein [Gemmatimonadota bacterium]MYI65919.1 hypothetical protein [Gemmatimonadota bacterium]
MTHLRNFGAAVLGYVVMYVVVIVLMLVMAFVVDEGAGWIVGSIVVSLFAAVMGGLVCAKVAANSGGMWILIAAVVVLGVAFAVAGPMMAEMASEAGVADAMDATEEPTWLAWLNPLLGAVGVYLGARLVKGE